MDFSDVLLTVDYDRTLTAPDSTIPDSLRAHGGLYFHLSGLLFDLALS